jgi:riboflavin-specific deaminase-like protein
LIKVIVSASADLPADSRSFDDVDGGGFIVATTARATGERVAALGRRAQVWRLGEDAVDLRELLRRLRSGGVQSLLVEGGGELNWALLRDDLLDELFVTIAPALLGGSAAPTLLEGAGFAMGELRRLRLAQVHREGDELYCRYEVLRA